MIRDYVTKDVQKIIVDDEATYHTVEELLQDMGLTEIRTEWYQEKEDKPTICPRICLRDPYSFFLALGDRKLGYP